LEAPSTVLQAWPLPRLHAGAAASQESVGLQRLHGQHVVPWEAQLERLGPERSALERPRQLLPPLLLVLKLPLAPMPLAQGLPVQLGPPPPAQGLPVQLGPQAPYALLGPPAQHELLGPLVLSALPVAPLLLLLAL
jgi:hypothetical protein